MVYCLTLKSGMAEISGQEPIQQNLYDTLLKFNTFFHLQQLKLFSYLSIWIDSMYIVWDSSCSIH